MEEHRPQNGSEPDDGLRAAVRGLIDSVTATSHQFADAAESFAQETARVLESFISRADHSAMESRDMAGLAGRAADEARRLSDESRSALEAAREQVRAEVEDLIAGVRSQLDEALRSTSESVADARTAAAEAQQRGREASEQVEQSLSASREAASAAEAAAEAARRSAEGIEQAVADARAGATAGTPALDPEVVDRIEESLAASREAAAAAEKAAEDARQAALEAMAHAADAKSPALEAGAGKGAAELLDRLEADYALLTELVRDLHARLGGVAAPASEANVEAAATEPDVAPQAAPEESPPQPSWAAVEPQATVSEAPSYGWAGPSDTEPEAAAPESAASDTTSPETPSAAWNGYAGTPAAEETALQSTAEEEPALPSETAAGDDGETAAEGWWSTPQSYVYLPEGVEPSPAATAPVNETPIEEEPSGALAQASEQSWPAAETEVSATDVVWKPAAWHWTSPDAAEGDDSEEVGEPATATVDETSGPAGAGAVTETDAAPLTAAEGRSPVLSGRVVLHLSPVPDFDRLLSLDGALGRLPFISNVTLADYAKEQVTFRVEVDESTDVERFTEALAAAGGQTLEVSAVEPGQLDLRIVRAGD